MFLQAENHYYIYSVMLQGSKPPQSATPHHIMPHSVHQKTISLNIIGWHKKVGSLYRNCPSLWPSGIDSRCCEFNSWQCRIYIPCSLSLRLLGSLRRSLGTYGLLTQKLCLKKIGHKRVPLFAPPCIYLN